MIVHLYNMLNVSGYGIVQFVAPLQCVDARPDKDNNRNLLVAIEKSGSFNISFRAKLVQHYLPNQINLA